jgi:hypothetical protein
MIEQLPKEIEEMITRQWREGVYTTRDRFRGLTGISWRPGDPNAVVQMILNHVGEEEIPLILDGHRFMVRRVG